MRGILGAFRKDHRWAFARPGKVHQGIEEPAAGPARLPADGGVPAGRGRVVLPGLAGDFRDLAGDRLRLVHRIDEPEVVLYFGERNEVVGVVVRVQTHGTRVVVEL